jgi:hypothetical protein
MEDHFLTISAKLSTHQFLLGQLYAQLFLASPQSLQTLPASLINAAKFKSHTSQLIDADQLTEIQKRVVEELEKFFADVEERVNQSLGR